MTTHKFEGDGNVKFVLAHASTEIKYDQRHTLVRLLLRYGDVIVFDLPGHGDEQITDAKPLSSSDMVRKFSETMDAIEQPYFFIGYSLGALLGTKYFANRPDKSYRAVMIGSGLRSNEISLKKIETFFEPSNYQSPNVAKTLRARHGPYWKNLLYSIQQNLVSEDNIMPTPDEIMKIQELPVNFILAQNDQAYSIDSLDGIPSERIARVKGNHFTYFHQKIGWPQTKAVILELISEFHHS